MLDNQLRLHEEDATHKGYLLPHRTFPSLLEMSALMLGRLITSGVDSDVVTSTISQLPDHVRLSAFGSKGEKLAYSTLAFAKRDPKVARALGLGLENDDTDEWYASNRCVGDEFEPRLYRIITNEEWLVYAGTWSWK